MNFKSWIIIAALIFGAAILFGLLAPQSVADLIEGDVAALEELSQFLVSLPGPVVALLIFTKNAMTVLISFALSPILCLAPITILTLNGWVIAYVALAVVRERSIGFLLAGLLPHGVFEIPALIIGNAAALSFGANLVLALLVREKRKRLVPTLKQDLKHLTLALALLVPAAIIETFITPLFL